MQKFYADTAHLDPSPARQKQFQDLQASLRDPAFVTEFTKNPRANAEIWNTISMTMLQGSNKINVIPTEATAQLDVRLLPKQVRKSFLTRTRPMGLSRRGGFVVFRVVPCQKTFAELLSEDPQAFINELRKVIADESIKIEPIHSFPPSSSPIDSRFVQVVREIANQYHPGKMVTHPLITGFTDCHYFREKNIPCYGFLPFKLTGKDLADFHANDERLSVDNLKFGKQIMYEM